MDVPWWWRRRSTVWPAPRGRQLCASQCWNDEARPVFGIDAPMVQGTSICAPNRFMRRAGLSYLERCWENRFHYCLFFYFITVRRNFRSCWKINGAHVDSPRCFVAGKENSLHLLGQTCPFTVDGVLTCTSPPLPRSFSPIVPVPVTSQDRACGRMPVNYPIFISRFLSSNRFLMQVFWVLKVELRGSVTQ